jgi:hypothetical protein
MHTEELARDKSLTKVKDNSGEWFTLALAAFNCLHIPLNATFTGESIRIWLSLMIPKSHSPNAWGALIGHLLRQGRIKPTGQYTKMTAKGSHARKTALYRVSE